MMLQLQSKMTMVTKQLLISLVDAGGVLSLDGSPVTASWATKIGN